MRHHILVDLNAEGICDDLSDSWTAKLWITMFDGLMAIAYLAILAEDMSIASQPISNRSRVLRLGALWRDLQITSNCCFRRRFSAINPLRPPGLVCLTSNVRRWIRKTASDLIHQIIDTRSGQ